MAKRRTAQSKTAHRADASISDDRGRLVDRIVAAWKDESHPGPITPHCSRPDCPAIAAYFSARPWPAVRFEEMRNAVGASWDGPMNFLPGAAFRYFLPAFLTMYINERGRIDVLGDAIVRSVCPHESWRTTVDGLSAAQKEAVLAFLRFARDEGASVSEVASGIEFWTRSLASDR